MLRRPAALIQVKGWLAVKSGSSGGTGAGQVECSVSCAQFGTARQRLDGVAAAVVRNVGPPTLSAACQDPLRELLHVLAPAGGVEVRRGSGLCCAVAWCDAVSPAHAADRNPTFLCRPPQPGQLLAPGTLTACTAWAGAGERDPWQSRTGKRYVENREKIFTVNDWQAKGTEEEEEEDIDQV